MPGAADMPDSDAERIAEAARLPACAADAITALLQAPLAAGLHLVATPIGNLADITLRALAVLARADVVLCEDTRHTGKLFARYGMAARLLPYHEHNAEAARPEVLRLLAEGRRVALVSDAGTPLVSDPGYKLVRAAIAAGIPVTALPGPSSVLAGLAVAGLPTDAFFFAGFLPTKAEARRQRLAEHRDRAGDAGAVRGTGADRGHDRRCRRGAG